MRRALLLAPFLLSFHVLAAGRTLPVPDASFDSGPGGWTLEGQNASPRIDGPRRSLLLESAVPARLTAVSGEVTLQVGQAYRLSAVIRTENVRSDESARYPTAASACLSMESFPFTNHSAAVGATRDFTKVETIFLATTAKDRVRLHLGKNGDATGKAWFDDVVLEELDDISALVPKESVRWSGEGYRYDDRGWIFVHVEGEPYARGFQFGSLVPDELVAYAKKLGTSENNQNPVAGWNAMRSMADTVFLRKFDEEYLLEMKGIADGAAKAGAKLEDGKDSKRAVDLLDVVTLNTAIDIDYMRNAIRSTPSAISGRSFLTAEEELAVPDNRHKCSSFTATGPATKDGKPVFGQIFMWSGYTGVHFNVLLDVQPAKGHRIVFQTFPGGIHSGTDFYMNDAGMVVGETTVSQTPFDIDGTPMSNRIRKAVQYGSSIDDVTRILREKNNGLYTNDWPMADMKANEVAILLLGTKKSRLWRSKEDMNPFGTPGFFFSNNNPRDPEVRKEYGVGPEDAPFDMAYSPMNRDIAFWEFYAKTKGKIDAQNAIALWASSPINRPHACDGKITNAEMAAQLVFLAHQGKTTLREKIPGVTRRMPDLPGATPHYTHGWTVASPIWMTRKLKEARGPATKPQPEPKETKLDVTAVEDRVKIDKAQLWKGSLVPQTPADNWLTSGSAAYWNLLNALPEDPAKAYRQLAERLATGNAKHAWLAAREGDLSAAEGAQVHDRYAPYAIPRVRGTFALHQLRLALGNGPFFRAMRAVHEEFREKPVSADGFAATVARAAKKDRKDIDAILSPWLTRKGFPSPKPSLTVTPKGKEFTVKLTVAQTGTPWPLRGSVLVESPGALVVKPFEGAEAEWTLATKPTRVTFGSGWDFPVALDSPYTFGSFADDFSRTLVVYGTVRQEEAHHTLAHRLATTLADGASEVLPRLVKDSDLTAEELSSYDLVLVGAPSENSVTASLAASLPATFANNVFTHQGKAYTRVDDGLYTVMPNPKNPKLAVHLFAANSVNELHQVTKNYPVGVPQWAVFRGDEVKSQGFHVPSGFELRP